MVWRGNFHRDTRAIMGASAGRRVFFSSLFLYLSVSGFSADFPKSPRPWHIESAPGSSAGLFVFGRRAVKRRKRERRTDECEREIGRARFSSLLSSTAGEQ